MTTNTFDATRFKPWLVAVAGAVLLGGCDSPHAWNDYLTPGYSWDKGPLLPPSSLPAIVTEASGTLSTEQLRAAVADAVHAPASVGPTAGAAPRQGAAGQGSSAPEVPAARTEWTFRFAPSGSDVGTGVHLQGRYYSDNELISAAEATGVVTNASDPRLRELIADVAGEFFPTVPRGGPGRK